MLKFLFLELLHNRGGATHVTIFSKIFFLRMTPFGVKMCGESEFEEFYKCQIRIPRTCLHQKGSLLGKNRIFATFRFNTQYAFPESGKRFFDIQNNGMNRRD